ncbi:Hypothetical protein CAP_5797 [Chondromyces apiculatus DSM 436]|uniref:Uncharacterized protein n=1 Tax=Chondromyces apiculatus DSM 436 TaxID=1192034 RepID=A0A017TGN1_9BACT|nr:Hypothetical protein CAP_5797 [Chondromyces apiculatus DSM 436]
MSTERQYPTARQHLEGAERRGGEERLEGLQLREEAAYDGHIRHGDLQSKVVVLQLLLC